ncbi:hypothetical protein EYR40_005200 [Pleurotus pulmonarius]|nr:hypothetical protein EYR40_005200 [Pleurotus pulmonarius]
MNSAKPTLPAQILSQTPSSSSITDRLWRRSLYNVLNQRPLDRVNVLGDNGHGHLSCVNALSWTPDGQILLSGGDDRTVRIWRMDPDGDVEYPFVCKSVIQTGHRANIFNAHLLPHSTRIVSVAGDKQVRVFEAAVALAHSQSEPETTYTANQLDCRVLRCHTNRVKRIVTEDSPDLFLTVAEDGSVRQHDLRVSHTCGPGGSCPAPLIKCQHELSTLALSPLSPYQFVVAGESPYGYLFDRRNTGRSFDEEWGALPPTTGPSIATCVRRFGRKFKPPNDVYGAHITGARMSAHNGHEVPYSGDGVYLYSTRDNPQDDESHGFSIIPPNREHRTDDIPITSDESRIEFHLTETDDNEMPSPLQRATEDQDDLDDSDEDDFTLDDMPWDDPGVPILLPRMRFAGAGNVETVKDVNFLGPEDEFVTSGSDDGNFFIWHKNTGQLHGIYEGDGSVVNVIEGHPFLPLIAVSGIDSTVKLFAPVNGSSEFSRTDRQEDIIRSNSRGSRQLMTRGQLALIRAALSGEQLSEGNPCNQLDSGYVQCNEDKFGVEASDDLLSHYRQLCHRTHTLLSNLHGLLRLFNVAPGMMVIGRGISRASQYSGYISNSAGDLLTPDRLTATSSLATTVTKGLKLCPTSRIDQRRSALIPTLSSTLAVIFQLLLLCGYVSAHFKFLSA